MTLEYISKEMRFVSRIDQVVLRFDIVDFKTLLNKYYLHDCNVFTSTFAECLTFACKFHNNFMSFINLISVLAIGLQ